MNNREVEVKVFLYDVKGNYISHHFATVTEKEALYKEINAKPRKMWNVMDEKLEFRYVTDNLNTDKEYAAEKWIIEKHRVYFYVLDPDKQSIELEFSKNVEGLLDRMLINRKISKHVCLQHFENKENSVLDFSRVHDSFDKIYYVTDVLDDSAAAKAIFAFLDEQAQAVRNELEFLEKMKAVSVEKVKTNKAALKDRTDIPPCDTLVDEAEMICPKCEEIFVKGDNIHSYNKDENDTTYICPNCKSTVAEDFIVEEIKPKKNKWSFDRLIMHKR